MTGDEPPQPPTPGPPPGWAPPHGQPPPAGAHPWPAYPPSGYMPPRRRRSRWLTVGLPVGLVLLLGGCGTLITLFVTAVGTSIKPAQQAATSYAQALVGHRWSDAQAMLCSQDQGVTSDQISAHYAHPGLTGYTVEGINVTDVNGKVSATASIRFTTADGLDNATTLPLTKEGGTWHPCP
jgi:hypothetical protein